MNALFIHCWVGRTIRGRYKIQGRLGIVDLGLEKIAFWDFGLPRPHFYQEKLPKLPTLCILCRIRGYIPLKWGLRLLFGNFVGNLAETTW